MLRWDLLPPSSELKIEEARSSKMLQSTRLHGVTSFSVTTAETSNLTKDMKFVMELRKNRFQKFLFMQ
jgi:hypothetical protein